MNTCCCTYERAIDNNIIQTKNKIKINKSHSIQYLIFNKCTLIIERMTVCRLKNTKERSTHTTFQHLFVL